MKRVSISIFMIILLCLIITAAVHAQGPVPVQIPNYINYQGKLLRYPKNPNQPPIPLSGTYNMSFRIYDAEDAPIDSPLWEETHLDVNVNVGIFNVLLGEFNPLYLRFEQDYWMGLEVYPDYEMRPRQRIVSTGYSFMSQDSYSLNGYEPGAGNGLNADMVDGINASANPEANRLLALDNAGKFPNSVLHTGEGNELDADMLDGVHYSAIASKISELDEKIEAHETNDEVVDDEGSYPNMRVGYANSAGSVSSAGYASTAGNADTVDGYHASSFASSGHTHPNEFIDGTRLYYCGWNGLLGDGKRYEWAINWPKAWKHTCISSACTWARSVNTISGTAFLCYYPSNGGNRVCEQKQECYRYL